MVDKNTKLVGQFLAPHLFHPLKFVPEKVGATIFEEKILFNPIKKISSLHWTFHSIKIDPEAPLMGPHPYKMVMKFCRRDPSKLPNPKSL